MRGLVRNDLPIISSDKQNFNGLIEGIGRMSPSFESQRLRFISLRSPRPHFNLHAFSSTLTPVLDVVWFLPPVLIPSPFLYMMMREKRETTKIRPAYLPIRVLDSPSALQNS